MSSEREEGTRTLRGQHAGVSREQIVDTALVLVQARGAGGLGIRSLARELGVTPAAIHWHVGSKDELVRMVVQRASDAFVALGLEGTSPRDRVIELGLADWQMIRAQPGVVQLAYNEGHWELLVAPLVERFHLELGAAGLDGPALDDGVLVVRSCVGGFLTHAMGSSRSSAAPPAEHIEDLLRSTLTVVVDALLAGDPSATTSSPTKSKETP